MITWLATIMLGNYIRYNWLNKEYKLFSIKFLVQYHSTLKYVHYNEYLISAVECSVVQFSVCLQGNKCNKLSVLSSPLARIHYSSISALFILIPTWKYQRNENKTRQALSSRQTSGTRRLNKPKKELKSWTMFGNVFLVLKQ